MRATAIIMVLCSHCLWIYPESNSPVSQIFKHFGFLGVEIFFVLSGFLIGKILLELFLNPKFSFHEIKYFLKRRWFRTFPNYFLILLINILIAGIIGYKIESLWKYFFFLHNFSGRMLAFFPESWSLSVEEWAYLILPFCLFIISFVFKRNKQFLFVGTVIFLIVIFQITKISYHLNTENTTLLQWNADLKPVVIYRLDSILYGVLASWIYSNFYSVWKKYRVVFLLIGIFGLLFLNFGITKVQFFGIEQNLFRNVFYLPLISISLIFFLPFLSEWKKTRNSIQKPIVYISLISYSIYLLHYCVILQLFKYYIPTENFGDFQLHIYCIVYLALTFVLSSFLFFFYERPIMNLREKF